MRKLIFILGVILLFVACVPVVQVVRIVPRPHSPNPRPVDIFRGEATAPSSCQVFAAVYVMMGRIELWQAENMLVKKAQELGGDALVLMGIKEAGQTISLVNLGSVQTGRISQDYFLWGKVVKYVPEPFVVRHTNFTFLPNSKIEVLTTATMPPNREYIELAEISLPVDRDYPTDTLFYVYEAARKIGADALILLNEKEKAAPMRDMIVGKAIRYKTSK